MESARAEGRSKTIEGTTEGASRLRLELWQLDLRYEEFRIRISAKQGRLLSSLAEHGQQSPVLVVPGPNEHYVLIDGYHRIKALKKLGRDTVEALILPMNEAEALVYGLREAKGTNRTALEEGWWIRELVEHHKFSLDQIAVSLERSKSWVSRRLALIKQLPEDVQLLVRKGKLCPYAAMKYLVPLARANKGSCIRLAKQLGQARLSTRQVGKLYTAWRRADKEERQRIEENPLLYLKAIEQLDRSMAEDKKEKDDHSALLKDLEILIRICNRIRRAFTGHEEMGLFARGKILKKLNKKWQESCLAFENTKETMEELLDVGRGQT